MLIVDVKAMPTNVAGTISVRLQAAKGRGDVGVSEIGTHILRRRIVLVNQCELDPAYALTRSTDSGQIVPAGRSIYATLPSSEALLLRVGCCVR